MKEYKEYGLNGKWLLKEEPIYSDISNYGKVVNEEDGWFDAAIPGDIHVDLQKKGKISEPLTGLNSFDSLWIEDRSWWYKKTFNTKLSWIEADTVELKLNGLDAMADIFLNDCHLGRHISTFRPFIMDVKHLLKNAGKENLLVIRLTSGLEYFSKKDISILGPFVFADQEDWGVPTNRGDKRRVFVRKPQYSFGWDWNPRVLTCGITGDVTLQPLKSAVIRNVYINSKLNDCKAHLDIEVNVESLDWIGTCEGKVNIEISDEYKNSFKINKEVLLRSGYNFIKMDLDIDKPHLWWPNGMGDQHQYKVNGSVSIAGNIVSCLTFYYGIRTVELDLEKINTDSRLFSIIINGKRAYCRGANWIPADAVYGRVSLEKYEYLIKEAKEANFTMLRVWGGGIYEKDCFYDYCDRYGILVWQDFMFACAAYPDHEEWFVEEIEKEVKYQTLRLRNHACIALWCGNNENHWGFYDWWKKKTRGGAKLYNKIIPDILDKYSPNIPYWNSSPYGGENPNSAEIGDTHHWFDATMSSEIENRINPLVYDRVNPRFISEYGYIGPYCKESTLKYLGNNYIDRNSSVWKHHMNINEKDLVIAGIKRNYIDTEDITDEEYLLYGGLCQGKILEYSLDSFRSKKDCNGGLFWMYNDSWGEVGWSIIDYYLKRKISYNFVRRANSPIRLIIRESDKRFFITLANDTSSALNDMLEFGYVSFTGEKRNINMLNISAKPFSRVICETDSKNNFDITKGCFFAKIKNHPEVTPAIYRELIVRKLKLPNPELSLVDFNMAGKDIYNLVIKTKYFTHAVHFNLHPDYLLSDEYFDLLPDEERKVTIKGKNLLEKKIRLMSVLL